MSLSDQARPSQRPVEHDSAPSAHDLLARADRIPVTRSHIVWISILALGYCVETFDNVAFAFLAPTIRSEWGLSLGQVGVVTSAAFLGMFAGAVAGGRLSDLFGRRRVLVWASVFYSLASLASAVSPNFETLAVSRVLTGVGVQAATGVLMVYVAEMFPRLSRGRFFAVMTFFGLIATPGTSFIALAITPTGDGAWRWVFAMGSAGLVVAVVASIALPESVRWLVNQNRLNDAARIVEDLERDASRRGALPAPTPVPLSEPHGSFGELFKAEYARRLVVASLGFSMLIFCVYGFTSWVPTVLVDGGMEQQDALRIASFASLGGLLGPVLLFGLADRVERKTIILLAGAIAGAGMTTFGALDDRGLVAAGIVTQVGLSMASVTFYTYLPEIFPTHVRGVGAGATNGAGRLAGVASGIAVATMYASWGATILYLVLGLGLVAMGLLMASLGPRTTRRSLEGISHD